jgi:hypothetical protein
MGNSKFSSSRYIELCGEIGFFEKYRTLWRYSKFDFLRNRELCGEIANLVLLDKKKILC